MPFVYIINKLDKVFVNSHRLAELGLMHMADLCTRLPKAASHPLCPAVQALLGAEQTEIFSPGSNAIP